MYEYINHVLANYLATSLGYSEDEAIANLRKDLKNSPELAKGVLMDLEKAFSDSTFSWKEVMTEYDVISTDNENEAHAYAKRILWSNLLGK